MKTRLTLLSLLVCAAAFGAGEPILRNSLSTNTEAALPDFLKNNLGQYRTNSQVSGSLHTDLAARIRDKLNANTNVFKLLIFGDSLADVDKNSCGILLGIERQLEQYYGIAGFAGRSINVVGGSAYRGHATSQGGTAASVNQLGGTNWWGLWHTGVSNTTVRWGHSEEANGDKCTRIGLYWIAYPEGTNFSFEISTNGAAFGRYALLAGQAATRTLRYTNITVPLNLYRVQAVTTNLGTNVYIGPELYDTSTNGIVAMFIQRGSAYLAEFTNTPLAIWNGVITNFDPDWSMFQGDETPQVGQALTEWAWTNHVAPWLLRGSNSVVTLMGNAFRGDAANNFLIDNGVLRNVAAQYNFMFIDSSAITKSWNHQVAAGWMKDPPADIIHWKSAGADAVGGMILSELGLIGPQRPPWNFSSKGSFTAARFNGDGGGLSNVTASVSNFSANGTNILWLDLATGRDQNGVLISTSVASGPYLKNMNSYFGNYFGYFAFYDPNVTTGYRAAYYTPTWPGIITAKTYRLTAYWIATNSFAYPMQFDISSFSAGGVVQLKSSASTFSYTGGTNLQADTRIVTFDNVPTSQPVIRYGYTGSWAITNLAIIQAISVEWAP